MKLYVFALTGAFLGAVVPAQAAVNPFAPKLVVPSEPSSEVRAPPSAGAGSGSNSALPAGGVPPGINRPGTPGGAQTGAMPSGMPSGMPGVATPGREGLLDMSPPVKLGTINGNPVYRVTLGEGEVVYSGADDVEVQALRAARESTLAAVERDVFDTRKFTEKTRAAAAESRHAEQVRALADVKKLTKTAREAATSTNAAATQVNKAVTALRQAMKTPGAALSAAISAVEEAEAHALTAAEPARTAAVKARIASGGMHVTSLREGKAAAAAGKTAAAAATAATLAAERAQAVVAAALRLEGRLEKERLNAKATPKTQGAATPSLTQPANQKEKHPHAVSQNPH